MNTKLIATLAAAAAAFALLLSILSYGAVHTLQSDDPTALATISALLTERDTDMRALQSAPFTEPNTGVLGSYLAKIRRDGMSKNAEMKQRLDELAMNTAALLTLVDLVEPKAKTPGFKTEAKKFRTYALAWTDRWNSVMETFMAGGNYPTAEVPFPRSFEDAVKAEMDASR